MKLLSSKLLKPKRHVISTALGDLFLPVLSSGDDFVQVTFELLTGTQNGTNTVNHYFKLVFRLCAVFDLIF